MWKFPEKIPVIFGELARSPKTGYIQDDYHIVLDRPPSDLYITYSVYWGTIKKISKLLILKGWTSLHKSSLDRPEKSGTIKGRFSSIVGVRVWSV